MTKAENLVNCFSNTSLDGRLPVYKKGNAFEIFQDKKPSKEFKKVADGKLIKYCSTYLKKHATLDEKESAVLQRIANQIKAPRPKPKGLAERFQRIVNTICSPIKNLFKEKKFQTDYQINRKKAEILSSEVEKRKASQKTQQENTPAIPRNDTSEVPETQEDIQDTSSQESNSFLEQIQKKVAERDRNKGTNQITEQIFDPKVEDKPDAGEQTSPQINENSPPLSDPRPLSDAQTIDEEPLNPQKEIRVPICPLKKVESKEAAFQKMIKMAKKAIEDQLRPLYAEEAPQVLVKKALLDLDQAALISKDGRVDYAKMPETIREIIEKDINAAKGYASREKALSTLDFKNRPFSLDWIEYSSFGDKGKRGLMEDAHFIKKLDDGLLIGLFDGHGGPQVSELVSKRFEEKFEGFLKSCEHNIYQAFKSAAYETQYAIINDPELDNIGTTGNLIFIDKEGFIYSFTLGDSKTLLFRKFSKEDESSEGVLLSPERNWRHEKEAKRAAKYTGFKERETEWPKARNPKKLRILGGMGVNVSRSFGDYIFNEYDGNMGISSNGKITVNQLNDGDFVAVGSDGVVDEVLPNQIEKILSSKGSNAAEPIVQYALNEGQSTDNVTAIVLQCKSR